MAASDAKQASIAQGQPAAAASSFWKALAQLAQVGIWGRFRVGLRAHGWILEGGMGEGWLA